MSNYQNLLANLERQLSQLRSMGDPQALQAALAQQFAQPASPAPVAPSAPATPPASSLSSQQEMLLAMYDEFAETDDGKALAASLGKFARFVQSKVAKQ